MPSQEFVLSCEIQAPTEKVFDFFADHECFGRIWSGTTRRIADGVDGINGVGSKRRIHLGPYSFDETTLTCQRPELIEYTSSRNSPLRNHKGRIEIHADGDGSRIHYTIGFDPRIPGTGRFMAYLIQRDWRRRIGSIIREIEQA